MSIKNYLYYVTWRHCSYSDDNYDSFPNEKSLLEFINNLIKTNPDARFTIIFGYKVELEAVEKVIEYRIKE